MKNKQPSATKVISAGREKQWTHGVINPPVYRASTVVFDSHKEMFEAAQNKNDMALFYGRRGTPTHFAFQTAIAELEGGVGCALFPSGAAAISGALLSFLKQGDHLLMVDSVYEPTRDICEQLLKGFGIETTYYDPLIGDKLTELIRPNTKVLFLESPGSITMEVQDVPTLCQIAKQHGLISILDNTWASPINCRPFAMGVDISIQAATKYIVGHSDVIMGTATANQRCWRQLQQQTYIMGHTTSADDVYLASRGLRTLSVRLAQHQKNALKIAHWLETRNEVERILHPAFASCPGHEFFKRDFSGSNGLFSLVLKPVSKAAVKSMLEGMQYFKMGFSWGGYESLILAYHQLYKARTSGNWGKNSTVIRLHVGLEDADDLIADLAAGFARMQASQQ